MLRRRAVNQYYTQLYPLMQKRYGGRDTFSSGQIIRTIEDCGFSKRYSAYALALFLAKDDLPCQLTEHGNKHNPDNLRKYIAKRFFDGNTDYSFEQAQRFIAGNSNYTSISHFEASHRD